MILIIIYVDDAGIFGNPEKIQYYINQIGKKWVITQKDSIDEFNGFEIKEHKEGLLITQTKMTNELKNLFDLPDTFYNSPAPGGQVLQPANETNELISEEYCQIYRSGTGKALYLTKITRADIANAVRELSRFMDKTTNEHFKAMIRLLKYLYDSKEWGIFLNPKDDEEMEIKAYADACFATDKEKRKSVTGYIIYMNDAVITWGSKTQRSVTLSSCEAEYVAISMCLTEVMFCTNILKTMNIKFKKPIVIYNDNTGAIGLSNNYSTSGRTRHIDIRHHHIREQVEYKYVKIDYINTNRNIADVFTKNLPEADFHLKISKVIYQNL